MRRLLIAAIVPVALCAQITVTMKQLPGTGQTRHFSDGDDSTHQIHPPSLTKHDDGTVTDNVTGLIWQQADGGEMAWEKAGPYCASLDLGGHRDWRLPHNKELFSVMNHNSPPPALDTNVFTRTPAEYWWSADPVAGNPARHWVVNKGGGSGPKSHDETISAGGELRYHARCVRGTFSKNIATAFTDNGNGTVTDNRTGLIWQQVDPENQMTWEEALTYAKGLKLAGASDWRVPNIKELQSLHDESAVRPAIATKYFPGARSELYWSSTTQVNREANKSWTINFAQGIVSYNPKTDRLRVRVVRGGN